MNIRAFQTGEQKTTTSMEDEFWKEFDRIAESKRMTWQELLLKVKEEAEPGRKLAHSLRLFVLSDVLKERDRLSRKLAKAEAK